MVNVRFPIRAKPKITIPKNMMKTSISVLADAIAKKVCLREWSYMRGRTILLNSYNNEVF